MDDTMFFNVNMDKLIPVYSKDCTILQVYSENKLEKEWFLLEEDDDHLFLKNDKNEVLFVRKNKKIDF